MSLQFSNEGFTIGSIEVPSFRLCLGEAICLHLPDTPLASRQYLSLVESLSGCRPRAEIRVPGKVIWAAPANVGTSLIARLRGGRCVTDWLTAKGIPRLQATEIAGRLGLAGDFRLDRLAMNPRTMLGLEAAWALGAETIVFSTVGCDPKGVQAAFAEVAKHLHHCSAIFLSGPYESAGRLARDHFPNATCVVMGERPTAKVSVA